MSLALTAFIKRQIIFTGSRFLEGRGASVQLWKLEVAPIGPLSKQQLPAVIDQVRITENRFFSLYQYQEKVFADEHAVFADPSFFNVFDFPLIKGNPSRPFTDDNSVIITQRTANKFFGDQDPIGKVIKTDRKELFTVSGVIKDFPNNSSLNYDMMMPMSFNAKFLEAFNFDINTNFTNYVYETYLLLKPGTSLQQLSKQITGIHLKHKPEDTDGDYVLLPLKKMHLYNADGNNQGMQTVRIFIAVALLILVIAWINYVNLSTARAMVRSKEISMRKIIGASSGNLFLQFVIETTLLFAAAAVFILPAYFNINAGV